MAKKRLGIGFAGLVESNITDKDLSQVLGEAKRKDALLEVDIEQIYPDPEQPRKEFRQETIEELADSIKTHGVLQPIIVIKDASRSGYKLVSGERRLRAAQLAQLETIPAILRNFTEQQRFEVALIENLQREDLNIIDTAIALSNLRDQFSMSPEEIGKRIGKSESAVKNIIRLNNLCAGAADAVIKDKITEGHARQVVSFDLESDQMDLVERIIKASWTVRQAEEFVRRKKNNISGYSVKTNSGSKLKALSQHGEEMAKKFAKTSGLEVKNAPMSKGGKIIIRYKTTDDLEVVKKSLFHES